MKPLQIKEATGVIKWFLNNRHFQAITIPYCGIYIVKNAMTMDYLIRHERKHEEQINKLGAFRFVLAYFYFCFKYGYFMNPFEIEARAAECL